MKPHNALFRTTVHLLISVSFCFKSAGAASLLRIAASYNIPTENSALAVAWSSSDDMLVIVSDYARDFTIVDSKGKVLNKFRRFGSVFGSFQSLGFIHGASDVLYRPDDTAVAGSALQTWKTLDAAQTTVLSGPPLRLSPRESHYQQFKVATDESFAVASFWRTNDNLGLYDFRASRAPVFYSLPFHITAMSTLGDTNVVALGNNKNVLNIFDLRLGKIRQVLKVVPQSQFGDTWIAPIAGSPDGSLVVVGTSVIAINAPFAGTKDELAWAKSLSGLRLIDRSTGQSNILNSQGNGPFRDLEWDPLGRYFVSIDVTGEGYIQPRDIKIPPLHLPHSKSAYAVAINPDGQYVAVAGDRGTIVYKVTF